MKVKDVLHCSFSQWYGTFRDVTVKSKIIKIPPDVLKYLLHDGTLTLPGGLNKDVIYTDSDEEDEEDKIQWNDVEVGDAETLSEEFSEFIKNVERSLKSLSGKVLPKLNWSAPQDSSWISTDKTMKCTTAADVFLLLKSSNFVMHDLTQPFDSCEDFEVNDSPKVDYDLVLRRWQNLHPGGEFRCYVFQKKLKAISQRNLDFYPHILREKSDIVRDIDDFFNRAIKEKFPSYDYVFDVYRQSKDKVFLIDFNPYGLTTDNALFSSEELENFKNRSESLQDIKIRFVENEDGIQPCPYRIYSMPDDILDLTTGTDINKLVDLMKLASQEQNQSSSDEAT